MGFNLAFKGLIYLLCLFVCLCFIGLLIIVLFTTDSFFMFVTINKMHKLVS